MQTALGLLLLLSLLGHAVGQGGGGSDGDRPFGGFGNRHNLSYPDKSVWNRTIGTTNIKQAGFLNKTGRTVVVVTYGRELREQNISQASVLYVFSADPITVLRARPACYVIPSSKDINYDSVSSAVASRNGTTVTTPLTEVLLNTTGQPLDDEARNALIAKYPPLEKFCTFAQIRQTTATDPATIPVTESEGNVLVMLTYDMFVKILSNALF